MTRVAIQGEAGAFSHEAAHKLLGPDIQLVPCRTFSEAFHAVSNGEADRAVRAACAIGLGLLRDRPVVPRLREVLASSPIAKLRGYCCVALGLIGTPDATEPIRRALERNSAPDVRAAAAIALAARPVFGAFGP